MDNKCMYIVQRVFDSYDDRQELNVAAFLNKFEADAIPYSNTMKWQN